MAEDFEYDFCLSYAGEDRPVVDSIANFLDKAGKKVFYDKFEPHNLLGKDLYIYLDEIYRTKAMYCVLFASEHYAKKVFTNHERKSAQARAFQQNKEYILPIRIDDTEIPGILPTTGYLSLQEFTPEKVAEILLKKLAAEPTRVVSPLGNSSAEHAATTNPWTEVKALVGNNNITPTLYDVVTEETEALVSELVPDQFPFAADFDNGYLKERISSYDTLTEPLLKTLITGAAWGTPAEAHLWTQSIERVANAHKQKLTSWNRLLLSLSYYPALLLMYGSGMAAIFNRNYETLATLLTENYIKSRHASDYTSPLQFLHVDTILNKASANEVFSTNLILPMNEHLHTILAKSMQVLTKDEDRYEKLFNTFEVLFAAMYADTYIENHLAEHGEEPSNIYVPYGRFCWLLYSGETTITKSIRADLASKGLEYAPLKAGLFGGSIERFVRSIDKVEQYSTRYGRGF